MGQAAFDLSTEAQEPSGAVRALGSILVVDDSEAARAHLRSLLSAEGHAVCEASDGETALRLVETEEIDLVVLDVIMPGMTGIDVCRRIRASRSSLELPIISVTCLTDRASRIRVRTAGADDFLERPVDPVELALRVRNLLSLKRHHQALREQAEQLEAEVMRRTQQLRGAVASLADAEARVRTSRDESIRRLATAVELRDGITARHGERVGLFAELLAARLGWGRDACEELRVAAALHDVGKVGIPDRILLKAGVLQDDEYEIMKGHAAIGRQILSGSQSAMLDVAASVAGAHHEWFSGGGYPDGLRGTDIPLAARVVSVADVFDALTTGRLYRAAMSLEHSLEVIRQGRVRQFDPDVVDALFEVLPGLLDAGELCSPNGPSRAQRG